MIKLKSLLRRGEFNFEYDGRCRVDYDKQGMWTGDRLLVALILEHGPDGRPDLAQELKGEIE
jgi:hypothetical protein